MQEKMIIRLNAEDMQALKILAASEMRHYRSQAALIIRQELKRRGLLPVENISIEGVKDEQ